MADGTTSIETTRDMGLDVIRAVALILMVSVHYMRLIPPGTQTVEFFKFIGESAPTFFFFAFGMTMVKFFEKDHGTRLKRLTSFLYVSIIHNIFVAKTFITGFFFILWIIQALFYITHTMFKKPDRWYITILFLTVISMFILPYKTVSDAFKFLIPGHFPLMPWGLFVISGYLFAKYKSRFTSITSALPVTAILISMMCIALNSYLGWSNLAINKWPMSAPYFIIFLGVITTLYNITNHYNSLFSLNIFLLPVQFISRHLLVAVVITYIASTPTMKLMTLFFSTDYIIQHAIYFLISGSIICILIQFMLMKGVLFLWEAYKKSNISFWAFNHFDAIAIISIAICSAGMGLTRYILYGPGSYLFGHGGLITAKKVAESYDMWVLTCLILMLFFSLLMIERRKRNTDPRSSKRHITIIVIVVLASFSTKFYPAVLENMYLMRSPHADMVSNGIKEFVAKNFKKDKLILLSHMKPVENKFILENNMSIYPYRCITKKMGDQSIAKDSVIFFAFAPHEIIKKKVFARAKFVSYSSYKSDLAEGGREKVKQELQKLFH